MQVFYQVEKTQEGTFYNWTCKCKNYSVISDFKDFINGEYVCDTCKGKEQNLNWIIKK